MVGKSTKPHKKAKGFETTCAQLIIKHSINERLRVYRKLSSLLRNRFSLMDALERIYNIESNNGKDVHDSMAIAVAAWMRAVQNGESFSMALRGWAPQSELLMLSVGDIANLDDALENLVKVVESVKRMKEPIVGAIAYPLFLLLATTLIIWAVGEFMVPPMVEAVPGLVWRGQGATLVALSAWVRENTLILFSIVPIIVIIIALTLPRWKGHLRASMDNIPPTLSFRSASD